MEQPESPPPDRRPDAAAPLVSVCAWCQRVWVDDCWVAAPPGAEPPAGGRVTHTICPDCAAAFGIEEELTP
jgi:hypothetical protein